MNKAVVLAGGVAQGEMIKRLKKRGYYTILVDYTNHPVAEPFADKFYRESTLDADAVRKIALHEKADRIMTCCTDQALATVSLLSEELGLPCYLSSKEGMNVTNKRLMKSVMMDNGIPTSKFIIVDNVKKFKGQRKTAGIDFPFVIKPVDCNSSKGVKKVYAEHSAQAALLEAIGFSRTGEAIVEQFVPGTEISVDLMVVDGNPVVLCMSESLKLGLADSFIISSGIYPAQLSDKTVVRIKEIALQIVDAFGIRNSPMLIQVLVDNDNVSVIEFSARTGGGLKYRMIELASGVDIISDTIDLFERGTWSLDDEAVKAERRRDIIVNEFVYCDAGIFGQIEGIEKCEKCQAVDRVSILKPMGSKIGGTKSSGDRIAAITYCAHTWDEYLLAHEIVVDSLRILNEDGIDIIRRDLLVGGMEK